MGIKCKELNFIGIDLATNSNMHTYSELQTCMRVLDGAMNRKEKTPLKSDLSDAGQIMEDIEALKQAKSIINDEIEVQYGK